MKRRLLRTLVFLTSAAVVCGVLQQGRAAACPWYFDEQQCEARLLGKTLQEVEAAVGCRPNFVSRPWQEHPELDESLWGPGISARAAWHFEWGSIIVEYNEQERSVTAEVTRYHPGPFERGRIEVSQQ
jgi:hypothetical protein